MTDEHKPIWALKFTGTGLLSPQALNRCQEQVNQWVAGGCVEPIILDAGVELVDMNRKSIADQDLDEAIESVQRDMQALSVKLDAYLTARQEPNHAEANSG